MKEYFSHDLKARNDRKMVRLAMAYGMQGIGIYWCIVEMLYEEEGRLMQSDCERIAYELRVDFEIVDSIISNFDLFKFDEIYFWSASVDRRIESQIQVSNGAKKAAELRWQKYRNQQDTVTNADAMQTHQKRNANKEKKSKEKESKEISNILTIEQKQQNFWGEILKAPREVGHNTETLKAFFNYWSETNAKGKMRFELEKTFQVNNRLATWYKNEKNWDRGGQVKKTMDSAKSNLFTALEIINNSEQ
jgi:hypothetical protein